MQINRVGIDVADQEMAALREKLAAGELDVAVTICDGDGGVYAWSVVDVNAGRPKAEIAAKMVRAWTHVFEVLTGGE